MALAVSAAYLLLVLLIHLIAFAFGSRVLEFAGLCCDQPADQVLYSVGAGFASLQLFLGGLALMVGLTIRSAVVLLLLMALAAGRGWKSAFQLCRESWKDFSGVLAPGAAKALALCCLFFLVLEGLLSTAPLTGSDAMHYHFTAPLLWIGGPERPILWLANSFFTGLSHELIALGLVLGGDRAALLLIFSGGCLTAAALFQMARKWMSFEWALVAVLTFVMTPMVFWQIGGAGSPDIWMGFYAMLAALAAGEGSDPARRRWLILAGAFAGAGAGVKYTGWILPVGILLFVLWLTRSILWTAACSAAALLTGVLPALRNFVWTGDPFFPFLDGWIGRVAMNAYAFAAVQADVHSKGFSVNPLHVLNFLIALPFSSDRFGLGSYFGPIVLAFLPLLFFCNWRTPLVRAAATLWLCMLLANALTSQMARFLLPAYPLALALVLAGAAAAFAKGGTIVRLACAATIVTFSLFCLASDTLYAKPFLPVALGLEGREAFLRRMAPDYQAAAFVNSELSSRRGKVLVFIRHLYYLRVPYEDGNPANSWLADPALLRNPDALRGFLQAHDIQWVLKSPNYPDALAKVFEECEQEGVLVPETHTETEAFLGNSRIYNNRLKVTTTLMRVTR